MYKNTNYKEENSDATKWQTKQIQKRIIHCGHSQAPPNHQCWHLSVLGRACIYTQKHTVHDILHVFLKLGFFL